MRRRLFRLASTASVVALLLLTLGWVRSSRRADYLVVSSATATYDIGSDAGALRMFRMPGPRFHGDMLRGAGSGYLCVRPEFRYDSVTPDWGRMWARPGWQGGFAPRASVPYWMPWLAAAALPLAWVARYGVPRWAVRAVPIAFTLWPLVLGALGLLPIEPRHAFMLVAASAWFAAALLLVWSRIVRIAGWLWPPERCRRLGQCIECGYDLRATRERCPECGAPVLGEAGPAAVARRFG